MREKEIDFLMEKLKFYRNVLLAIVSGVIIVVYNVINEKAEAESLILAGAGAIGSMVVAVIIKVLEKRIYSLLKEIEWLNL